MIEKSFGPNNKEYAAKTIIMIEGWIQNKSDVNNYNYNVHLLNILHRMPISKSILYSHNF